jgi:hypothetical protein
VADAVREIAPGARLIAAVGVPGLVLEEAAADAEE